MLSNYLKDIIPLGEEGLIRNKTSPKYSFRCGHVANYLPKSSSTATGLVTAEQKVPYVCGLKKHSLDDK